MVLVKNRKVVEGDPWTLALDDQPVPAEGDVIVGLGRYLKDPDEWRQRSGRLGVRIDPTDEALSLAGKLEGVALIAIHFPKFSDGRGYTKARQVRERLGFEGEVRAVGDVLPDQLYYMQRCGIDAFALKEGKKAEHAIACLEDLTVAYQGASDDPRPLYRRGR